MTLTTDRLTIRPWREDDAERLFDIMSRMEVMQWLGDGEPVLMTDVEQARQRVAPWNERSANPPLGYWAVEVTDTGLLAGSVLLLTLPNAEDGEVEIGWWLHPDCWGQGYATEAAKVVLAHGFAGGLPEILAVTHLGNDPSMNVCRKLGMAYEGVVEKWYEGPFELFRIRASEYAAQG